MAHRATRPFHRLVGVGAAQEPAFGGQLAAPWQDNRDLSDADCLLLRQMISALRELSRQYQQSAISLNRKCPECLQGKLRDTRRPSEVLRFYA